MPAGKRNALLYPFNGRSCSPVQLASCSQAPLWSQPEYSSSCSPGITFYLLSSSFRLKQYFNKWNKFFKAASAICLGQSAGFCFGREVIPTTPLSLRETGIDVSSSHEPEEHVIYSKQLSSLLGPGLQEGWAPSWQPHCHGLKNQSFHTFGSVASPELSDLLKSPGFFLGT